MGTKAAMTANNTPRAKSDLLSPPTQVTELTNGTSPFAARCDPSFSIPENLPLEGLAHTCVVTFYTPHPPFIAPPFFFIVTYLYSRLILKMGGLKCRC